MSSDTLPDEIWSHIFYYLLPPGWGNTAQTCQRFHALCQESKDVIVAKSRSLRRFIKHDSSFTQVGEDTDHVWIGRPTKADFYCVHTAAVSSGHHVIELAIYDYRFLYFGVSSDGYAPDAFSLICNEFAWLISNGGSCAAGSDSRYGTYPYFTEALLRRADLGYGYGNDGQPSVPADRVVIELDLRDEHNRRVAFYHPVGKSVRGGKSLSIPRHAPPLRITVLARAAEVALRLLPVDTWRATYTA